MKHSKKHIKKSGSAAKYLTALTLSAALASFSCTENAPPSSGNSLNGQQNEGSAVMQPYARSSPQAGHSAPSPTVAKANSGELRSLSDDALPPPAVPPQFNNDPMRTTSQTPRRGPAAAQPPVSAAPEDAGPHVPSGPDIPKNAEWTIYCTSITGEDHLHRATVLKNQLSELTHMRDFWLDNSDAETTLHYGFYQTIELKEKDGQRAKADRDRLAGVTNSAGEHPLAACWMMQLSTADPAAPAEWNLVNKNKNLRPGQMPFYWTIEVASYRGAKERKEYAVDLVKQLREHGVEAYYYHGRTTSSVCIGAWPESAVRHDETAWDNVDPNRPVMIIDSRIRNTNQQAVTPDGTPVQMLRNQYVIEDAGIKKVMKEYPFHALNGEGRTVEQTDPQTHKTTEIQDPSFLTAIPGAAKATVGVGNSLVPYSRIEWVTGGNDAGGPGNPSGTTPSGNSSNESNGVILPPIALPQQPAGGNGN